jgi:hypothetical protein
MMRTWEEKVKFRFGSCHEEQEYEVSVFGIPDNDQANVHDGFHIIQR